MHVAAEVPEIVVPVRGKPKSGRVWKTEKNKFSSMVQVKSLKSSWVKKQKQRQEKQAMLMLDRELKEKKQQEIERRKQRRREKLERKRENERKAEIVQPIRNTAKIKRMSKKKLRRIEKRDTNPISGKTA